VWSAVDLGQGSRGDQAQDVPYGQAPLRLVWHKRRWRCREAGCPRGSFTESLPVVPARARVTTRLRAECGAGIATRFSCVSAGAGHYGVSWPIAHAAFVAHVDPVLAQPLPPVQVLGIDETRRGKVQWGQDPDTGRWFVLADRWHTGIVDAAGTGGLLAHIDGRTAAKVAEWIAEQPDSWRAGITHVTIDLSASYLRAVTDALPNAVVVADRFHLVRLANDMVTEVRQHATRDVRGRRGRKRDPEWAGRRKLLIAHERLDPAAFAKLWNALIDAGDPGIEILHAYTVKENLRHLLALSATFPERSLIRDRLWAPVRAGRHLDLARGPPVRCDHRAVVAGHRGRDHHRLLQRPIRGVQPPRETPRPQRVRLPQRAQSSPRRTLGLHSSTPASLSCDQRGARSSSMSRVT
jgi:transposase